jgi:hypothetical protein
MLVILATLEAKIRRMMVQGQSEQTVHETLISKITRAKWTGDVAQEIKHLLCKCKAEFKHESHQKKKKSITEEYLRLMHFKNLLIYS